jgi:phospholipid/cholesterol/gamma-HCH transport system substrate-binding protein
MLTRGVRVKVIVFVVIGLLAIAYIGVRYVGLLRLVGVGVYTVHLELPSTGGIFPNAEVDYRGVPVGRVSGVRLTAKGVQADLQLNNSAPKIPADVQAVVADRSVIGEQFVDMRPRVDTGPYLADGATVTSTAQDLPPSAASLLSSTNALLKSIPLGSLRTVVVEMDKAFGGSAQNVRRLIDTSREFFQAATQNFPQTAVLIDSSATVLKTQLRTASSIRDFSRGLKVISGQLASSNPDLRSLLQAAPSAALSAERLIRDIGTPLGVTLTNLTTTSQVFLANLNGVRELLVQVPHAVDIGSRVVTPQGANVGLTLTFFNPLPCTAGYQGTVRRSGLDTSPGRPLNTSAGCASSASSSSDARGSQHVPSDTGVTQQWVRTFGDAQGTTIHSLRGLMGQ